MKNETVYIGIIKNNTIDAKTIVIAENELNALNKVKEKFNEYLNNEDEIQICLFSDGYK